MVARFVRRLARLLGDRRGGVSPLLALMIIPLVGMLGVATEASSWFLTQRSAQNAADSAAMAAASNGCEATAACHTGNLSPTYADEARSVAAQFGFTADTSTTVTPTKVACPNGTAGCYQVVITKQIPIYMVRLVGFNGDADLNGGRAQTVSATSIASPAAATNTYCLLALGTGAQSIRSNGGNKIDMSGCKVGTNGGAQCNGHDLNADAVEAVGSTNCAATSGGNHSGQPAITDPYAALATNIPPNDTCSPKLSAGGYPQTSLPASNMLSGNIVMTSTPMKLCGNVVLTADTNITTPADGAVMVIRNGSLSIPSGMTLKTLAGSGLTIIFDDADGPIVGFNPSHILTGGGTIDIASPTSSSSVWSGVAIYQDPSMTAGIDFAAAGNSPTWKISGLIYLPKSNVSMGGIVNKASNGHDCFALVVNTFLTNGTGTILEHQSECVSQGLTPPSGGALARQALVQ